MHVRIKIYREFYHGIIYIANEGRHVRIKEYSIPCHDKLAVAIW